ncbi:metallophosphoesterase [Bacillus horti]|uniref:Phosphoesterase n=1 Tax=Caldalkalibacillus horti TaxID=77523 RepID=A0ABT9W2G7_9BACI|nr:metallophosphoesterase [Bacillus horti]MDQ0167436.1 putative phosphoesterase [Bacillus horti]
MRALIMSDLHLDINKEILNGNVKSDYLKWLNRQIYDVLILAGDLAGDATAALKLIEEIKETTRRAVYFIAGNHDVWVPKEANSSWEAYHSMNENESCISSPIKIGDYTMIGGMGWYDYSLGYSHVTMNHFKEQKKHLRKDSIYARWEMDDKEVVDKMLNQWQHQLDNHRSDRVIFINHFIPYKDFITWHTDNEELNFCNAYMGSERIGELLDNYKNIEYVIFGHTHQRYGIVDYRGKKIICQPFGLVTDWEGNSMVEELDRVATFIDL